jgi:hypothetical protein
VGSGGSLDAEYPLKADVRAGAYHVICDAIIIRAVDVQFELLHRRAGEDVQLATWMEHFEPIGAYTSQPYELDVEAPAIAFEPGDELVFRYTGLGSTVMMAFIPNGDGALLNGRVPNITLPK